MLQAIGLSVSSVEYAPSDYKDLVSEVKYKGRSILPGTRIPEGSSVVLVVGSGEGFPDAEIPNLKGMTLTEATDEATLKQFAIGAVEYDVQPDGNEDDYVVYRQRPSATTIIQVGTKIDVYLSKNKQRMKEVFEEDNKKEETNEQFF
jgi:serine/threonine-protein kinase